MRAPVAATASGVIALTVAAVPTGMKAGVSMAPCAVVSRPSRAAPSRARISKPIVTAPAPGRRNLDRGRPARIAGRRPAIRGRRCLDQAGVAVGEKAVALGDGVRVGGLDPVEPGQRRDQHQQRRARQVEIGQQHVDRAKPVARQDEQPRLAVEGPDLAAFGGGAFEEAHAGRADRDDAPAGRARGVDAGGGFGVDDAALGMHAVRSRVVRLDRQKRAGADMQGHGDPGDAARREPVEQSRGEMQPGGRRRDGALGAGEHRLVVGAVARVSAARRA